jgi:hypothetical protein
MLGHRLTHDATATVVTCDAVTHGLHAAGGGGGIRFSFAGENALNFDLIVDVTPEGAAAPFRAKTSMRFGIFHTPHPGDTLKARCNPEHKTVQLDVDDDERFDPRLYERAEQQKHEDAAEQILNQSPGSAPAPPAGEVGPAEFAAGAKGFAEAARDFRASADAFRKRAEARSSSAARPGASPGIADPVARLRKLTDLRDSGLLTAAEFDEQKARILGEI